MVAFNFKKEFSGPVERREKRRTIRKTKRAKVGDKIQLYTGMRTTNCRKLVDDDPVCTLVLHVEIVDEHNLRCEGHRQSNEILTSFANSDGFETYPEMVQFFKNQYGLPFSGYLHQWDWQ